mmetsp:Transcript_44155/g.116886  ORF Transcript_44155/g.116886 Transcript_44155/m.116886 type:complete len:204 (-) Transcript_44155:17-628(-)
MSARGTVSKTMFQSINDRPNMSEFFKLRNNEGTAPEKTIALDSGTASRGTTPATTINKLTNIPPPPMPPAEQRMLPAKSKTAHTAVRRGSTTSHLISQKWCNLSGSGMSRLPKRKLTSCSYIVVRPAACPGSLRGTVEKLPTTLVRFGSSAYRKKLPTEASSARTGSKRSAPTTWNTQIKKDTGVVNMRKQRVVLWQTNRMYV